MKSAPIFFGRRRRVHWLTLFLLLAALTPMGLRAETPAPAPPNVAQEEPAVASPKPAEALAAGEPGFIERLTARLLQYTPWRIAALRIAKTPVSAAKDAVASRAAADDKAGTPVLAVPPPKQSPAPQSPAPSEAKASDSKVETNEAPPPQNAAAGFIGRMTARLTSFLPGKLGAPPPAEPSPAMPRVAEESAQPVAEQKTAPGKLENPVGAASTQAAAEPAAAPAENTAAPPAAAVAATAGAAPPDAREPVLLIRHLQDVQEKVAGGDRAAFAEQPRLMKALTQTFAAAAPEVWGKVENARALILYLLSGGSPKLGHKILATHQFAASEEPLAKGALAYLEDRSGPDQDYLLGLDPRALDLNLGGQAAFIQSILLTGVDRAAAIERLDLARLLMPGSLVEEAALRREVALLAETQDFDKFAGLARQYWTRFRASPYADNFLRQFTLAAARVSLSIKPGEWPRLDELLENLPPESRRAIYLNMAHAAVVSGNVALAATVAQRGLPLFEERSLDRQRAQLYIAAAQIATPDFARSEAMLGKIDRARLAPGDALLAQATTIVATEMRRPPQQGFSAEPPGEPSAVDATLARARTDLQAADEAMDSIRKTMERKTP